jgi:hypothetical protein
VGSHSGYNTTGDFNTTIGLESFYDLTSGFRNTGVGAWSGLNTTGNYNVAIGYQSLGTNVDGSANTAIRYFADVAGSSQSNSTAIGNGAIASASNEMRFGNGNVTDWGFGTTPTAGRALQVGSSSSNGNGAYLSDGGAWSNGSDVNLKDNITTLKYMDVLQLVTQLPISRWHYKGTENEYHIGPMAQDFHRLFKTGLDDKSISTIDPAGVALAAIKGLVEIIDNYKSSLSEQIESLKAEQAVMAAQLSELTARGILNEGTCIPIKEAKGILYQNTPNPFNSEALIRYAVNRINKSGQIHVYSREGNVLNTFKLDKPGVGEIRINADLLTQGAYAYDLVVDGTLVDIKQFVVIK